MTSRDPRGRSPVLSVVVPMYQEEAGVRPLLQRLVPVLESIGEPFEILLVDDGSRDRTWERIEAECRSDRRVRGISLLRNFGHQGALYAGMSHATGEAVVTMDADLQHPPEIVPALVAAWRAGYQVVQTRRTDSPDVGWFKRTTSRAFYRLFSKVSGLELDPGSADFRLLDARVVEILLAMKDPALFLRGAVQWVGCPTAEVPFQAGVRASGRSQYSFAKMLHLAADGVISFSSLPLKLGLWVGIATGLLAFVEIGYILLQYAAGNTVPGWASVLTVMSFMFGTLFFLLGILGAYVAKIYDGVKQRPAFLTGERVGWGRDSVERVA